MPRTECRFTQADINRAIRAAKQAGCGSVELRRDGTIVVNVNSEKAKIDIDTEEDIVL